MREVIFTKELSMQSKSRPAKIALANQGRPVNRRRARPCNQCVAATRHASLQPAGPVCSACVCWRFPKAYSQMTGSIWGGRIHLQHCLVLVRAGHFRIMFVIAASQASCSWF
ncbi:hypothetical protein NLU13_0447 [Sarocladium strictum]|uniref:Uncharacterized protein n=1 Tax=Sarocladium strictum TaxID=5046 RepID=A0AA39GPU8_SARSR|nr:hypothetical protein NLU13_0447 [Sarocladium strictum]